MEDILVVIIQFVIEVILNILTSFPWDLVSYRYEKEENNNTVSKCFWLLILGFFVGFLSLLVSHKSWVSKPYLRIANLIISPILAGYISVKVAQFIHIKKEDVWPKRHFWYSFCLCLGYVMVRFVGTHNPNFNYILH